jgi:hypothetical protein
MRRPERPATQCGELAGRQLPVVEQAATGLFDPLQQAGLREHQRLLELGTGTIHARKGCLHPANQGRGALFVPCSRRHPQHAKEVGLAELGALFGVLVAVASPDEHGDQAAVSRPPAATCRRHSRRGRGDHPLVEHRFVGGKPLETGQQAGRDGLSVGDPQSLERIGQAQFNRDHPVLTDPICFRDHPDAGYLAVELRHHIVRLCCWH